MSRSLCNGWPPPTSDPARVDERTSHLQYRSGASFSDMAIWPAADDRRATSQPIADGHAMLASRRPGWRMYSGSRCGAGRVA